MTKIDFWREKNIADIDRLLCLNEFISKNETDLLDIVNRVHRHFLDACCDTFLEDYDIGLKVNLIKIKLRLLKKKTSPQQYLLIWLEIGKIIELWIDELEGLECYEAAGNIKKIFDLC